MHELYEDLEIEVTEKPTSISLVTRLRHRAKDPDGKRYGYYPSHVDMLYEAADEIERLQEIVRCNKPTTLLKEIWKHQPVYLFEAISDVTSHEGADTESRP
jgi:hypothetical protein